MVAVAEPSLNKKAKLDVAASVQLFERNAQLGAKWQCTWDGNILNLKDDGSVEAFQSQGKWIYADTGVHVTVVRLRNSDG